MIKISLPDKSILEFEKEIPVYEVIKSIGMSLYKAACCCKIDGEVKDLRYIIKNDCELEVCTFDTEEGQRAFNHTASHILAQAVKRLYKNVKLAIGPSIENGFYYDFDIDEPFSAQDLEKIEKEMAKIAKENLPIEKFTLSPDEAIKFMEDKGEDYKVLLIKEHADKGEDISFYKQGDFTDLCAGPHLMSTGSVKAIALTSTTGAYWKGDSKNKMLTRIYGTAFPKKSLLEEYIKTLEEAQKRDHNKLGRELEFFTTADIIGQGLPILLPKGAKVIQLLQRFVEDEEEKRGWLLTKTPYMAKSDLYKVSGHWDHYKDGMFVLGDEEKDDEVFALRPMTCPFQYQAYLNRPRSYKDLPLRYNETSTLFRNEASGEMHGLIRVRQFTISEGHDICRPDQLEEEFKNALELAIYMLKTLGLYENISYRFSKWDENDRDKYIGTAEQWEHSQGLMEKILNNLGIEYKVGVGEAAFYGPKLDIQIKNVFGKEDTLITIQIDQMLAKTFGMVYTDNDGEKKTPYIIHRTSIGCYERTLALLIEKYAGAFPLWLSPEQVRILPISDKFLDYANKVKAKLDENGLRTTVDTRNEKIGYKIRQAKQEKLPYMLIVGEKEETSDTVSVRHRTKDDIGSMSIQDFITSCKEDIETKVIW
ncbi:MAG: threonine--tRNA ligase [Clostridia bacterium]|nr:threonine--tRNA ligase [Clostridia bacterium]